MNDPAVRSLIAEQELRLLSVREFSLEPVTCYHLLPWPTGQLSTGWFQCRSVPRVCRSSRLEDAMRNDDLSDHRFASNLPSCVAGSITQGSRLARSRELPLYTPGIAVLAYGSIPIIAVEPRLGLTKAWIKETGRWRATSST
jgi:hypothetical protein